MFYNVHFAFNKLQYVDFELNCIIISVQTHFNSAVPNFKLKINNMIELKARGNGLLEAHGNGSIMFTLRLINFSMLISS